MKAAFGRDVTLECHNDLARFRRSGTRSLTHASEAARATGRVSGMVDVLLVEASCASWLGTAMLAWLPYAAGSPGFDSPPLTDCDQMEFSLVAEDEAVRRDLLDELFKEEAGPVDPLVRAVGARLRGCVIAAHRSRARGTHSDRLFAYSQPRQHMEGPAVEPVDL